MDGGGLDIVYNQKIKVLIIDDSLVFREALARGISFDPLIEALPSARDPYDAWQKMKFVNPDVLTCDMEMPGMNGIDFIAKVMREAPRPIIAVSSREDLAKRALQAGAFAFLSKPRAPTKGDVQRFILELSKQIRKAAHKAAHSPQISGRNPIDIIAIGASTGGTEALHAVLSSLPPTLPGIVIVQHIPAVFSTMFADRLNQVSTINVREAKNGDFIEPGTALIAPGDQQMTVHRYGQRFRVECRSGEKINGHCPSVDVLFDSVAHAAGKHAVGILLTGMGNDGAKGLLNMRKVGARTLGQDEKSSVVYGMPKAAYDIGAVEKQVSLDAMKSALLNLC
ncbi:chemotaxis-specific protein-glutamate methyltransferase CheB [Paenibacillus camelliae]|uniref:chemotaxis-specific protein-glutamate methyltransferase CheB n=1 Tax=Paenibacillus camelliae TaxID=512410 RepID=UPI00203A40E7|nr:chemotaxis-specific protein-glutamate methyltransferase CheB [Paenibacillus camelliae]